MIDVQAVRSYRDLKKFVKLPQKIYEHSPHWTPPLWSDEFKGYKKSNPVLADCEFELFLAYRFGSDEVLGRVMVYLDPNFNKHEGRNSALFGAYDVFDYPEVSLALMEAAQVWATRRGLDDLVGPINPIAEFWGILMDNFDQSAMFLTPYNHPYYAEHLSAAGFEKEVDLWAYVADAKDAYELPERYDHFVELFKKKHPQFTVRQFDPQRLKEEALHILQVSNIALAANWGYVPVGEEVFKDMISRLKLILDPDAIWFVEDGGKPVGFCLGWPDFNLVLKKMQGRLFPLGWTHLFRTLPKVKDFRLFGLAVLPEYHGKGLDAFLYIHLYKALAPRGIRLEANFILEENSKMNNALLRLGLKRSKSYRMFNRRLS